MRTRNAQRFPENLVKAIVEGIKRQIKMDEDGLTILMRFAEDSRGSELGKSQKKRTKRTRKNEKTFMAWSFTVF